MVRIAINSEDMLYGTTNDQREGVNIDDTNAEYAHQIRDAVREITDEPVEITIGPGVDESSVYVEDDDTKEQVNDAIQAVFNRQDFWR